MKTPCQLTPVARLLLNCCRLLLIGGSAALLPALAHAQVVTVSNLWSISTAEGRPYLTNASASSYTERGVAYSAVANHAYIVSRQGGVKVAILDGDTGAEVGFLNVSGIAGGTFALSTIGVAEDGAIYAANLTTTSTTSPYKIYRWADESAAPVVVFSGNPSGATANRYGESFDVRGSGINTEIIATANAAAIVAIFKPTDETMAAFTSTRLDVTGLTAAGDLTKGVGFGPTNTFFGKNNGVTGLRFCRYDLGAGTAAVLSSFTVAGGLAPVDADPANSLLAGVETANAASPHNLRVYDLSSGSPVQIYINAFPAPAANNGNLVGQVQIRGDRIFAVDTQNGVQMAKIFVNNNPVPPSVTAQPGDQTVVQGGYTTLTVGATGTRPLAYQWYFGETLIPGATTNTLNLTNLTLADAGNYSVAISNEAGTTNSTSAVLTITPAALNSVMTRSWLQEPGSRFYLGADNNQRGLAYNPATDHLIIVSRTPTNGIHVLDANTGEYLWSMNLAGISGGTFIINMVACTEDGQVFVGNLTSDSVNPATPYKLYAYLEDAAAAEPILAWSGDPGAGATNRWGDNLDVRGTGSAVEALIASRNGKIVSRLQGIGLVPSLPPTVITVPDADNGNFGLSVVFGAGDTFWGKSSGSPLRQVSYNVDTQLGTVVKTITNYPGMNVIGLDPVNQQVAGLSLETPDNLRLLNVEDLPGVALELDTEIFPTDNPNLNGTGAVRFGKGKLFALQSNNGLMAVTVWPKLRLAVSGTTLTLTWDGTHTLQSATDITGPWTDVADAVSGYSVNGANAGNLFFRLKD